VFGSGRPPVEAGRSLAIVIGAIGRRSNGRPVVGGPAAASETTRRKGARGLR